MLRYRRDPWKRGSTTRHIAQTKFLRYGEVKKKKSSNTPVERVLFVNILGKEDQRHVTSTIQVFTAKLIKRIIQISNNSSRTKPTNQTNKRTTTVVLMTGQLFQ